MKKLIPVIAIILLSIPAFAEAEEEKVAAENTKEIVKTGFSPGGFPIIAFDNDKGFQLGALCNLYDFGDGSYYPNPRQQLYAEASWFTKGSQLYVLNYDNRFLIPKVRFSFVAQFSNEKAMDFYGFNGYQSYYDPSMPSAYYKFGRKVPHGKLDFTGEITKHLYWKFGYHFKYFIIDSFTSSTLDDHDVTPMGYTLFDWYKHFGLINPDEVKGGMTSSWLAGIMYDSRDVESAPSRGIWAEASFEYAPKWMGTNKPYCKYYASFRHYVPILADNLVFAMRGTVQGYIGKPAFYVIPYDSFLGYGYDRDGFGGYRNIRAILRDRVQGKSTFYFNTELRWKFVHFSLFKQNISLGLSAFFDGGRVLVPYESDDNSFDPSLAIIPEQLRRLSLNGLDKEKFHLSAGAGFRFIMNRNFIIAVEYGMPFNSQDNSKVGKDGNIKNTGAFYVNTGYLF